jgi:hypothetical protein
LNTYKEQAQGTAPTTKPQRTLPNNILLQVRQYYIYAKNAFYGVKVVCFYDNLQILKHFFYYKNNLVANKTIF